MWGEALETSRVDFSTIYNACMKSCSSVNSELTHLVWATVKSEVHRGISCGMQYN